MTTMGTAARRLSLRAHFGPDRHADALPTLYVALFLGDPFGGGTEPTAAGGYARVAVPNDAALWGTVAPGAVSVSNLAAVAWPVASALWSVTSALDYWAVFDNSTGGVLWYAGPLNPAGKITITGAGDQARLPAAGWIIGQAG